MAKAALLDISGKRLPEGTPKTSKRSFEWLEQRPRPEWFVKIKSPSGRVQWFVRFKVTGLETRRYGPFAGKRQCLQFLDEALEVIWYDGPFELEKAQGKHCIKTCQFEPSNSDVYPVLERTIAAHADSVKPKQGR